MTTILLHAIGLDAGSWRFTDVPGAVPIDLPGFGEQPLPPGGLSEPDMADDVVRRAPEGMLDVVGVSMGGQVAMLIGLRHPDRVRSLVVANTGPAANPEMMRQRAADVRRLGMEAAIPGTLERWFTQEAIASGHPAVAYARERLRRNDAEAFASGWDAIAGHDVKDRLHELRMPVTVIAGDADKAGRVEDVRGIHERVPGSRFVVLNGPHILYMEFPDLFRSAVMDHLAWASKL